MDFQVTSIPSSLIYYFKRIFKNMFDLNFWRCVRMKLLNESHFRGILISNLNNKNAMSLMMWRMSHVIHIIAYVFLPRKMSWTHHKYFKFQFNFLLLLLHSPTIYWKLRNFRACLQFKKVIRFLKVLIPLLVIGLSWLESWLQK